MRAAFTPYRTPLESRDAIVAFAVIRTWTAVAGAAAFAILGFPYGGSATAVVLAVAVPWSLFVLLITRRSGDAGLNPLIALGDMAVLGILVGVEPDMYAPAHFLALGLVAAHAHFPGAGWSLIMGAIPPVVLIPVTLSTDVPIDDGLLHAYEVVFAVACLSVAFVVGALREAETSARLRARALSRRAIDTESGLRRRLAQSIHDGPIQELASVELMLATAEQALDQSDPTRAREALHEARSLTRTNVSFLRDEIADLGPDAFDERSYDQAIADCLYLWERRYGVKLEAQVHAGDMPAEVAGPLFQITQEAVANAGKHAGASKIAIRLHCEAGSVQLEVEDDGRGFGDVNPLGLAEPGHIGLASMRERAEMLGGRLVVQSGYGGTLVRVSVPL